MTIVWSERAIVHLRHVRAHIARDRPAAAQQMAATLLGTVELLADQPGLGRPGRVRGTRELMIPGTPYVVPYRVRGDRLEIIGVFHGRQRWPETL